MSYGRSPDIIGVDMSRGAGRDILNGRHEPLTPVERGPVRIAWMAAEPPRPGERCITCGTEAQADAEWPGGVRYDWTTRELTVRGQAVSFTRIEGLMFREIVRARGAVVTYDAIIAAVWAPGYFDDERGRGHHGLRVNMTRIRARLRERGVEEFVITVIGLGYRVLVPSGRSEGLA